MQPCNFDLSLYKGMKAESTVFQNTLTWRISGPAKHKITGGRK
jgi:hypothetical protein